MQLSSGSTVGLTKRDAGYSLSIRLGNGFMSADLTEDELDQLVSEFVKETLVGTQNEIAIYGTDFDSVADPRD